MDKKTQVPIWGRMIIVLLTIILLVTGCTGTIPGGVDLSKPETVSDLISKAKLNDAQLKQLDEIINKARGVNGSQTVDPAVLQRLADLEAKKTELTQKIDALQKQGTDLDKKVTDSQTATTSQIANNNLALITDFNNKIGGFNAQLSSLSSRLNDQAVKLSDLDSTTRSFISQNKSDIAQLYSSVNQLKASGVIYDQHVQVVKDLQARVDSMNDIFARIFNSTKTATEVTEENRQVLEKLMVNNFVRLVLVDVTDAQKPKAFSAGSANLLFRSGNTLVFSTASHVSKELYLSQQGIGKQKFGLHIGPLQMLGLKTSADKPVIFGYQDIPNTNKVLVTDKYASLVEQERAFLIDIQNYEAQILALYQQVYALAVTLSFHNSLTLPDPSTLTNAEQAYDTMMYLQMQISMNTPTAADQTVLGNLNPLFAKLNDIVNNHINNDYQALATLSQQELTEDTSLVLVQDPDNQLKDVKPLLNLVNGQLIPQTVTINGKQVVIPFTIDNILGTGVYNVGVTTDIYAGGVPFDSLDTDMQDVKVDYNGSVLETAMEADIWFEHKQISRVHQSNAGIAPKKGIPNYFQVTGNMGHGSSGGLNWTIESYKSKALASGGQPVLTKEGKIILLGYDNTLRTTDALPVYISPEGILTEVANGAFLRVGNDGKMSNGIKAITNDLQWVELKTMQGLGVNSFGVLDFWGSVQSINVANFAASASTLKTKLESALNITIPSSVYKKNLAITLAQ